MKITAEVSSVLEQLTYEGHTATITSGQLDRKLYTEVNKVLEACGGKWNRKTKTHVFPEDAEPILSTAINAGEVRTAKEDGFFPTPSPLAAVLAAEIGITKGSTVLEPSAGTGSLVRAALDCGAEVVICVERDAKRRETLKGIDSKRVLVDETDDFLLFDRTGRYSHVIMNPAFYKVGLGDHLDHVKHAWRSLSKGGQLGAILPASVKFRTDRRHSGFRAWAESYGGKFADLPEGSFKSSGTMVRTVQLIMRG